MRLSKKNMDDCIIKAVRKVANRVAKDKYLLSMESDFMVMLYNELVRDRRISELAINTEHHIVKSDYIDMIIYDKNKRFFTGKLHNGLIPIVNVNKMKAIIELKIGWARTGTNKKNAFIEDIKKRKSFRKKVDRMYFIMMEICGKDNFEKNNLCDLKDNDKKIVLIYSNPIIKPNKFFICK